MTGSTNVGAKPPICAQEAGAHCAFAMFGSGAEDEAPGVRGGRLCAAAPPARTAGSNTATTVGRRMYVLPVAYSGPASAKRSTARLVASEGEHKCAISFVR